jgi:hypothetical protein
MRLGKSVLFGVVVDMRRNGKLGHVLRDCMLATKQHEGGIVEYHVCSTRGEARVRARQRVRQRVRERESVCVCVMCAWCMHTHFERVRVSFRECVTQE